MTATYMHMRPCPLGWVGLGWVGYYNHEVLWCTSPVLTGTLATDTRLPSFPKVMKVSNRSVGIKRLIIKQKENIPQQQH